MQKIRTTLQTAKNWLLKFSPIQTIYIKLYFMITGLFIIPKEVRFIWLGSKLPDKYRANLIQWAKVNPDYNIHLYIDSAALPLETVKNDVSEMQSFCDHNKIQLHDIATMPKYSSVAKAPWYNDWINGAHKVYALASDYLRLAILREGGVYADTDTTCVIPLGTLVNTTGLFVWGSSKLFAEPVFSDNCFIASKANNSILNDCMQRMQDNYKNLIFKGNLPQKILVRVSYTPLENDPDVVYKTLRFPHSANDGDIGYTFSAGHVLYVFSQHILRNYGKEGIKDSIFEINDKVLHDAHRSWMVGKKRAQRMGTILVDNSNIEQYQQDLLDQKMTPQLAALRG